MELGSPALSASVLRLGSGSLSVRISLKCASSWLYSQVVVNLCFFGGGIFEAKERTLDCDSDISKSPLPGEPI